MGIELSLQGKMGEEKLSKKQQKALLFKKSKEEREQELAAKAEKKEKTEKKEKKEKKDVKEGEEESSKRKADDSSEAVEGEEQPKKKRKTRRGKKGKGVNGGKGPRFILFVGNLPYDIKEPELVAHFKNANPDRIRIRKEKGIAFLEFDNDNSEIQSKMEHALRMHKLMIRNRKINVELTVGGGGNSENRQQKLKEKNEKLEEERKERIKKQNEALRKEKGAHGNEDEVEGASGQPAMHPARAALLRS
uniref:RRM domain-containing protein n=1 Tax=Candidozyma auris TaxID=498019 RepID=A0A0L0NWP1_CANAR